MEINSYVSKRKVSLIAAICFFFDTAQNDKLLVYNSQAELCRSLIIKLKINKRSY
jgi:hypothetical protein